MESLQDKLLEHVVPDQTGIVGKIRYSFTDMKIVHVHWPKVSSVDGVFVATNGALRIQGQYLLQRPGVLGYNKSGDFVFDLGGICLSIRENASGSQNSHGATSQHHRDRHHQNNPLREVTCTVGYIKVKFHGGAAMICQLLTSLYIKMYRRHLEGQIAEVIQETIKDDQQLLMSALTVMAAMNNENQTTDHEEANSHEAQHRDHQGRMSRFFYGFRRHSLNSRPTPQ